MPNPYPYPLPGFSLAPAGSPNKKKKKWKKWNCSPSNKLRGKYPATRQKGQGYTFKRWIMFKWDGSFKILIDPEEYIQHLNWSKLLWKNILFKTKRCVKVIKFYRLHYCSKFSFQKTTFELSCLPLRIYDYSTLQINISQDMIDLFKQTVKLANFAYGKRSGKGPQLSELLSLFQTSLLVIS